MNHVEFIFLAQFGIFNLKFKKALKNTQWLPDNLIFKLEVKIHFLHSFIRQLFYITLLGPGLCFIFLLSFTQTVGLLGRVISSSQGRYLHRGQHKHRINSHTDIHALSGIRTQAPSVWASEDSSCLRPRGRCVRWLKLIHQTNAATFLRRGWFIAADCISEWKLLFT
jgi:hypothetical protein